ncbi:MAG: dihydrolipoamide acetyltransferase family protein [Candidatus Bipolaricaulia bacterium]
MALEFKLPDVGEGVHEGEIVQWLVEEGGEIEEDQSIVEVMTDKATVEIPAPRSGVLLKRYAEEGDIVEVGSVILVIGDEGEEVPAEGAAAAAESAETAEASADQEAASGATAAAETAAPAASGDGQQPAASQGRVLATPATRKLARELGVDISQVPGSGPAGRVTDDDVRALAESGASAEAPAEAEGAPEAAPAAAAPEPDRAQEPVSTMPSAPERPRVRGEQQEDRVPLRGMRRRISDHMREAKDTAAHFTYVDELDVTELVSVRESLKETAKEQGIKLTYLPFIVKACVAALKKHPYVNASLDHENEEIVFKHYYNIGVAAATQQGLMVPVVKNADMMSMLEIAAEIERLAGLAREGKVNPEDLQGGTFTITSLGAQGGMLSTPVVNTPESAILGVHEIKKKPAVVDDEIVIRQQMMLALSFDHRLVDGHVGAAFAKDVKAFLENPKWLMVGA